MVNVSIRLRSIGPRVFVCASHSARPYTIIERDGLCSIRAGKIAGTVAARWWIAAQEGARVAAQARRFAGVSPVVSSSLARGNADVTLRGVVRLELTLYRF